MRLDETDRSLIGLLSDDARLTNRELARRVGLSPSACLARVKKLESAGVIVGYRAVIARNGAGRRLEGWADIKLVEPTSDIVERFLRLVSATPEIIEAHRTVGHYDYAVRFCSGDLSTWNDFRNSLAALGCEAQSRVSILIESLK